MNIRRFPDKKAVSKPGLNCIPEKLISNLPCVMKNWVIDNKLILIGAILGAFGGYFYYRLIGCAGGTCLISSKPFNSTIYFGFLGAVLFSLFKKKTGDKVK